MRRPVFFRLILGLAALCAIAAIALHLRSGGEPRAAWRLSLPAGTEYVYDLSWTGDQSTVVAGTPLDGSHDVEGSLVVRSHGWRDGAWQIEVRFGELSRHRLTALGGELAAEPALLGGAIGVSLGADGAVEAIRIPDGTPELSAQVLPALLRVLEVRVPADAGTAWEATGAAPFGTARTGYRAEGRAVVRRRAAYTELRIAPPDVTADEVSIDSAGRAELDPAGHLRALDDVEVVTATRGGEPIAHGRSELHLRLARVSTFTAGAELGGTPRRLDDPPPLSAATAAALLEARVDGLAWDGLLEGIVAGDGAGHIPDENRWIWRATGLLLREPALCDELAGLIIAGEVGRPGAALVFDLLAAAGSPAAQAAMRDALGADWVRADEALHGMLLQRFAIVATPDAETAAFVLDAHRNSPAGLERAAALTAGAVAGRADDDVAAPLRAALIEDLGSAEDPSRRAAIAAALGNAGAGAETIGLASDPDPEVRAAVARALRGAGAAGRDALLGLARDGDRGVTDDALASLAEHDLGASDLARLRDAVEVGELGAEHAGAIATLVERGVALGDPARELARAVLALDLDPNLRARLAGFDS